MQMSRRGPAFIFAFLRSAGLASSLAFFVGCAPSGGIGHTTPPLSSNHEDESDNDALDFSGMLSSTPVGRREAFEKSIVGLEFFNSRRVAIATCTGIAIRRDVVLTTAHCFNPDAGETIRVFTTANLRGVQLNSAGAFTVARVVPHARYNSEAVTVNGVFYPTYDHDMALVFLNHALNSSIRPHALPNGSENFSAGAKLVGYGFGFSQEVNALGSATDDLLVDRLQRGEFVLGEARLKDRVYTRSDSKSSVCYGDSGGPIFLPGSKKASPRLVALISAVGSGKFFKDSKKSLCRGASVLQPIAPEREWIDRTLRENGR